MFNNNTETKSQSFKDIILSMTTIIFKPWATILFFLAPALFSVHDFKTYSAFFFLLIFSYQDKYMTSESKWYVYIFRTITTILFVSFVLHIDASKYLN